MKPEDHSQHPAEPARAAGPATAPAALAVIERRLDELYQLLRGARSANALMEARTSVKDQDYGKALGLVQATRDFLTRTPPRDWQKLGAKISRAKADPKDVLARLDAVLSLLQRLSELQPRGPKAALASPAPKAAPAQADPSPPGEPPQDTPKASVGPDRQLPATIIDMGVFTQLLTAAQQCGLAINTDAIASVRDREFPAGRYQRALDVIEGLYGQMSAQATRRQAELRREETQYRAGTLKMSPKHWLLRQRRERDQTQRIERARRYFARVLDGLRVLRAAHPEG